MSIRSEGDVVAASNAACELSFLVARFLIFWRKHANGVNGVHVPSGDFTVVLNKPELGNDEVVRVSATLICKHTRTYETPTYFDPDDDNYSESWGSSNISGYEIRSESSIESNGYLIPWNLLPLSDALLKQKILAIAEAHKAKEAKQARDAEIIALRSKLAKLEATSSVIDAAMQAQPAQQGEPS